MDYLLLARIGKIVALVGFFLPWVTVSCSGTVLLEATGLQLMTGDLQPSEAFAQIEGAQAERAEPAVGIIVAFVVILAGIVAGTFLKGRNAPIAVLAAAVLGMGLCYFSLENMRGELSRTAYEEAPVEESPFMSEEQQRELARSASGAIRIEEQEGYWLTLGAQGVAAILCLVMLFGPARREPEVATPPPS